MSDPSRERHRLVGRNIQASRGEMSQQDVAQRMRDLGHRWSQSTVSSVENGERPLRFDEAMDLAGVLKRSVYTFWRPVGEASGRVAVQQNLGRLRDARINLERAAALFEYAQERLAAVLEHNREALIEGGDSQLVMSTAERSLQTTPTDVITYEPEMRAARDALRLGELSARRLRYDMPRLGPDDGEREGERDASLAGALAEAADLIEKGKMEARRGEHPEEA